MALTTHSPFAVPGHWFRGNLHTHTTESDGVRSPEAVLAWHEDNGYDFDAITDHDRITHVNWSGETRPEASGQGRLLPLSGVEISLGRTRQGSPLHCVAIGLAAATLPGRFDSPAAALDWAWQQDAFVFIAHPHWSGFSSDELAQLPGMQAIEVFNTGCDRENHKGLAVTYWDDLLARGLWVTGLATDDSHWRDLDYGGGWLMVKAPALSAGDILAALRAGLFYSTCGPAIEDIQLDGRFLHVKCSPAASIYWIGAGRLGYSVHAPAGETLTES